MPKLFVNCDGSIRPKNPGGYAGGGYVVRSLQKHIKTGYVDLGQSPEMTNNIAEYAAVLASLEYLVDNNLIDHCIFVRTDSNLVVHQLNKKYKCYNKNLKIYRDKIWELVKKFKEVHFQWVPRKDNTEADAASRVPYERFQKSQGW